MSIEQYTVGPEKISMTALCQCGCGEPAPIARKTKTSAGHIKGQPMRFCMGHGTRGVKRSAETRRKISAYQQNRPPEVAAKISATRIALRLIDPNATSNGVHQWIRKHFTKTGICEKCGERGKPKRGMRAGTDWAFLRHPGPATRDRADYRELCYPCHLAFDVENGTRERWTSANNPTALRHKAILAELNERLATLRSEDPARAEGFAEAVGLVATFGKRIRRAN